MGVNDQVVSDVGGQFKLVVREGPVLSERFLVWAEYCDEDGVAYTSETIACEVESVPTTPATLELKRAAILRGRLIASDGSQLRKATVYGYVLKGVAVWPLAPLGVNGAEFEMRNLPYGRLNVWADSDTQSSLLYRGRGSNVVAIDITEPDTEIMDFVLQPKVHVRGRASTSDGHPIAGASLGLFSPNVFLSNRSSLFAPGAPLEVTSDAEGQFSVFVHPYGKAYLQVHCPGYDFGGAHGERRFSIELSPGSVHNLDFVGRKIEPEKE
ncbi:MAG TPA: carboxypeptidase-like regulatory domain-containing protein [Phycisphaerae bacterium]